MTGEERRVYVGMILALMAWTMGWCAAAGKWLLGLALILWCFLCGAVAAWWRR